MTTQNRIATFTSYFERQLDVVAGLSTEALADDPDVGMRVSMHRQILYCGMLDCLTGIRYRRWGGREFRRLLRDHTTWTESGWVSIPVLKARLAGQDGPQALSDWIEERLARGNPDAGNSDPLALFDVPLGDLLPLSAGDERVTEILKKTRHRELVYTYRNFIVHEFRRPGYAMEDRSEGTGEPRYHSYIKDASWCLLYPDDFFHRLAADVVASLRDWLLAESLDPYDRVPSTEAWADLTFLRVSSLAKRKNAGDRIADNPSQDKLRRDTQGFAAFAPAAPVLRRLGNIGKALADGAEKAVEIEKKRAEMVGTIDRFNLHFVPLGWCAYDWLNLERMREAVELADDGDLEAAETVLIELHSPGEIERSLQVMWAHPAFRPREHLAQLALRDHREGRYYSTVLVLLTLIDGFVNDVSRSKGFAAEGTNLEVYDSIGGHHTSVPALKELMLSTRTKTTEDPLSVPYRHGIMHGRDLSFDSELVAAKCWAAFFSLREWAIAMRDGKTEAVEDADEREPSWRELLKGVSDLSAEKERLEAWSPRQSELALPEDGATKSEELGEGTPERRVAEFLEWWRLGHWGKMVDCLPPQYVESKSKEAGVLKGDFGLFGLEDFRVTGVVDEAPACSEVGARLSIVNDGYPDQEVAVRAVYQAPDGTSLVRGADGGSWVLHTNFLWRLRSTQARSGEEE